MHGMLPPVEQQQGVVMTAGVPGWVRSVWDFTLDKLGRIAVGMRKKSKELLNGTGLNNSSEVPRHPEKLMQYYAESFIPEQCGGKLHEFIINLREKDNGGGNKEWVAERNGIKELARNDGLTIQGVIRVGVSLHSVVGALCDIDC